MKPEELRSLSLLELLRARTAARIQLRRAQLGNRNDPAERATADAVRARLAALEHRLEELGARP